MKKIGAEIVVVGARVIESFAIPAGTFTGTSLKKNLSTLRGQTMRNLKSLSLLCLILLAGCHKKNGDGSPVGVGSLPGSCTAYVPKQYTGAVVEGDCPPKIPQCQTPIQTVLVEANIIDYEGDRLDVKLYYPDGTYRTVPCQNISIGKGKVLIIAGKEAGYTHYAIDEQLCR